MVYAKKSRFTSKRRAPVRRTYRKRTAAAPRYAKSTRLASKRLSSGVQWKSTLYGDDIALQGGTTNTYFLATNLVSNIPKYRNDPTATATQANLDQARTSDKLFLKGFKASLGVNNKSTYATALRVVLIRSISLLEVPSSNSSNWVESLDGGATTPSTEMQSHMTERLNGDLVRNKRKDIIFDKRFLLGGTATLDRSAQQAKHFFVPCNHTCVFESKGDSTSATHLRTGQYYLMMWLVNHDEANGGYTNIHYDINAVWAQA